MKIRNAVRPELVFLDLEAESADEALTVIADKLAGAGVLDGEKIRQALVEREKLGSTSVGNGFAIPHCKLAKLDSIVVALARIRSGVDFSDGRDHQPVRFFFVVLSPPEQPAEHLQVLSQIARVLKNGDLRSGLMAEEDATAVVQAIGRAAELEGL
jgi:mannitol/fructose-specific phosphotransferase system IIA component (Ntr-type)